MKFLLLFLQTLLSDSENSQPRVGNADRTCNEAEVDFQVNVYVGAKASVHIYKRSLVMVEEQRKSAWCAPPLSETQTAPTVNSQRHSRTFTGLHTCTHNYSLTASTDAKLYITLWVTIKVWGFPMKQISSRPFQSVQRFSLLLHWGRRSKMSASRPLLRESSVSRPERYVLMGRYSVFTFSFNRLPSHRRCEINRWCCVERCKAPAWCQKAELNETLLPLW